MCQNVVNVYKNEITVRISSPLELDYKIINGDITFTEDYVRLSSKKGEVLLLLPKSNTVVIYPENLS
jgi:hypothetical protein